MAKSNKTKIIYNLNFDKMSKSEIEDIISNAIIKADERKNHKMPKEKGQRVSNIESIKRIWNLRKKEYVLNNKKMVDIALFTGVELLIQLTIFILQIFLIINTCGIVIYHITQIIYNPSSLNVILGVISIAAIIFAAGLYFIVFKFLDQCLSNYSYNLSDLSVFGGILIAFVALLIAISSNWGIHDSIKNIIDNHKYNIVGNSIQNTYKNDTCPFSFEMNN